MPEKGGAEDARSKRGGEERLGASCEGANSDHESPSTLCAVFLPGRAEQGFCRQPVLILSLSCEGVSSHVWLC